MKGDRATEVPVLYIGGCQRSGSTLLDRIVSQVSGHVSAGEVVHLWARGLAANELCGCGKSFGDCSFWIEVGRVGFSGWDAVSADEILALQRRVDRNRYIPLMLLPQLSQRYRRDLERYASFLDRLYGAIHQVGGGVVVDSSKHASTAFLLRRVSSVQLRVIHLVRDSRGVAFSLLKKVPRPEVLEGESFMHRATAWRSGFEWMAFNALFHVLRLTGTPTLLTRYEVLVRDPAGTLRAVLARESGTFDRDGLSFVDGDEILLGSDHTVAGNPMRFEHGMFQLKVDDAWRRSMKASDRLITTALTWPLLACYGYLRRSAK